MTAAQAAAVLETLDEELGGPAGRKRQRAPKPRHDVSRHFDWIADNAQHTLKTFKTILKHGAVWSVKRLAELVDRDKGTISRQCATLAAAGLIIKGKKNRRDGHMCILEVNFDFEPQTAPNPAPRKSPQPEQSRGCCTDANEGRSPKGLHPGLVRTPSPSSEAPTRAREADPTPEGKQEGGETQTRAPTKPAVAGSAPTLAPGESFRQHQQHQRWKRRDPETEIKRNRWCKRLFHWAQLDLALGRGNVAAADIELLDWALYHTRHGHWFDLTPAQRARIEEINAAHKTSPPPEFEMPEERRRRERVASAPAPAIATPVRFVAGLAEVEAILARAAR